MPQSTPTNVVSVALGTTSAQLQHLIDTAAKGTSLQLQAGHYAFAQTITIGRDDISLTGAGSGKTFIDVPSSLGKEAFKLGDGRMSGDFRLAADVDEGGRSLTLTGAHSLVAGDFVYLSRESTPEFYDSIGDQTWRNTDVALRTSIVEVTAVNGRVITLASGVHFDFVTGETQVHEISMAEGVALGGFTIDYGLDEADPSRFANTKSLYDRNAVIEVNGTADLSLFDIQSHDVPSLGVNVAASTGVAASHITMTGAHNKGDGGNGYALQIRDVYDSKFTNLSDADMRHSVVFASWRSAAGNEVHVAQTDRDINFHGGRDHDNVVMVDRSMRDANSDIIAPTLFVNTEGTHYGSVTDASANTVKFGHVVGTRLNDAVSGYDNGALLDGAGGNDTLTGGAGNDLLIGGSGRDVLIGGGGEDTARYAGNWSDFVITDLGQGRFEVRDKVGTQATDMVSQVEFLRFDNGNLQLSTMNFIGGGQQNGGFDGPGLYDPHDSTPPDAPAVVVPAGPVAAPVITSKITGSDKGDHLNGTDARDMVEGLAGNDKLYGKGGDDVLLAGAGNDQVHGGDGNDRIDGGSGQDKLTGGLGADVFVFVSESESPRGKSDKILDFQTGIDRIDLSAIDANTHVAGNQAFEWRQADDGPGSVWLKSGYLFADTDGNGYADLSIRVGDAHLVQTDILF